MPRLTRIRVNSWGGLNINTPKAMLKPEETAWLQNFVGRRGGSLALRPGYARFRHGSPVIQITEVNSDDFNRANEDLGDGADWSNVSVFYAADKDDVAIVTSGKIEAGELAAFKTGAAAWVGDVIAADQYAEIELLEVGDNHSMGVGVRNQNDTIRTIPANGYSWGYSGYAPSPALALIWNNVSHGNYPYTWTSGDRIRIEVLGDEIRCYLNDSQVLDTVYDSSFATGEPYVWAYSWFGGATTVGTMDNFACGTVDREGKEGIKVSGLPAKAFHFERDDGSVLLVVAHGGKFDAFEVGDVEWSS
jgi:hypothetical protein